MYRPILEVWETRQANCLRKVILIFTSYELINDYGLCKNEKKETAEEWNKRIEGSMTSFKKINQLMYKKQFCCKPQNTS